MLNFIIGIVLGWFAHLHYGEQIMAAIARLTGE
jgi:hypothetical protein